MTGSKAFTELKNLAAKVGPLIYRRVSLAAECLRDRGWVEDETGGGGDESTARERIEHECFPELAKTDFGIDVLLTLYEAFPNEVEWQAIDYRLSALYARWEELQVEQGRGRTPISRISYKDLTERLQARIESLENQLQLRDSRIKEQTETIKQLRLSLNDRDTEVTDLRKATARLEGRLEEMERILDRQTAPVA